MQCLDHNNTTDAKSQIAGQLDAIRERGAAFVYSHRFGEWILIARGADAKRKLLRRYGSGLAIYTLDEARLLATFNDEQARHAHQVVRDFQGTVEEKPWVA